VKDGSLDTDDDFTWGPVTGADVSAMVFVLNNRYVGSTTWPLSKQLARVFYKPRSEAVLMKRLSGLARYERRYHRRQG
jgi:hypothetical protein